MATATPAGCIRPRGDPPQGGGPADLPRRPRRSIPLLPSGPGGIFDLASRGADEAAMGLELWRWTRILAERGGFEPPKRGLDAYTLSRRAPSTTRTPLRVASRPGFLPPGGPRILSRAGRPEQA